jgi:hypothetical protein
MFINRHVQFLKLSLDLLRDADKVSIMFKSNKEIDPKPIIQARYMVKIVFKEPFRILSLFTIGSGVQFRL